MQIFRLMFNVIQRKIATFITSVQDVQGYMLRQAIVDRLLGMLHYKSAAIKSGGQIPSIV